MTTDQTSTVAEITTVFADVTSDVESTVISTDQETSTIAATTETAFSSNLYISTKSYLLLFGIHNRAPTNSNSNWSIE